MPACGRCQPRTIPYVFPGDETFQVLEGEVHIETEGGESVDLRPRGHRVVLKRPGCNLDDLEAVQEVLRRQRLTQEA